MSEAVLQQYEHDMVHEHNVSGCGCRSKRQQWALDLQRTETERLYYTRMWTHTITHTHTLCDGVMMTDYCTELCISESDIDQMEQQHLP